MLQSNELLDYFDRLNIPAAGRQAILSIRDTEPSRATESTTVSAASRYPSKKMHVTLQAESRTVELTALTCWDHDQDTVEIYDQPPSIKLRYADAKGAMVSHRATPDYFLLQRNFAGWVECKTEEELEKHVADGKHRYLRDASGRWRCPAGEEFAATLGLGFKVWTPAEVSELFAVNLVYLADFWPDGNTPVDDALQLALTSRLATEKRMRLQDLLDEYGTDSQRRAEIYRLIAHNIIYVDLNRHRIAKPEMAQVFVDQATGDAWFALQVQADAKSYATDFAGPVTFAPGETILLDNQEYKVLTVGGDKVTLRGADNSTRTIDLSVALQQAKLGLIRLICDGLNEASRRVEGIIARASTQDLQDALNRANWLRYEDAQAAGDHSVDRPQGKYPCQRTLKLWRSQTKAALLQHSNEFAGLVTYRCKRGNRTPRLDDRTLELMREQLSAWKNNPDNHSLKYYFGKLLKSCEEKSLVAPSYKTFTQARKSFDIHEVKKNHHGEKAAYDLKPYLTIDRYTPRHGERPWEVGHIDHTTFDVQLKTNAAGGKTRKAHLTVLLDAHTRYVLAWVLSFNPPGYASCMNVIRECVRRHNRLPDRIVSDGGAEFQSIYYETLLGRVKVSKINRQKGQPRAGCLIERWFGVANEEFAHLLKGNNTPLQNPRQLSKSHDPRLRTEWDLVSLDDALSRYIENTYHLKQLEKLGASPKEAFEEGNLRAGSRDVRYIPCDQSFYLLTLPSTRKGTSRVIRGHGIKLNNIYYTGASIRRAGMAGKDLEVRYDPLDVSAAWVYVDGCWSKLKSEYAAEFKHHSVKEIQILSDEIIRRAKDSGQRQIINARILADALLTPDTDSPSYRQRLKDQESRQVLESVTAQDAPWFQ
ncbi:MAG: DDE-type integrase/transposase/recombinase, partial [Rhodocyclaceae bacterium]|nr:DDE-type integrase/transposase/recombinase [Rhodocyclaceae bacterium]